MTKKRLIKPTRVLEIQETFTFLEHRFLQQGFFEHLTQHGLLFYLFLVLVSDRQGISYYSYDRLCSMTGTTLDEYICARDGLIDTYLLAFDGFFFQVLALPHHAVIRRQPQSPGDASRGGEPATIFDLLRHFLSPQERFENAD